MRVVALCPYPEEAPSTRFRVAQFSGPLKERGVEVEILPFFSPEEFRALYRPGKGFRKVQILLGALRRRMGQLEQAGEGDVILVHRELAPVLGGPFLKVLRQLDRPIVFDYDDAVFLQAEGGNRLLKGVRRPRAWWEGLVRAAGSVWAGNEHLAEAARGVGGSGGRVEVVPTVIDTHRYTVRPTAPGSDLHGLPTLGWIGTHSTVPYLEALAEPLRRVAAQVPFRLVVVGNREPRMGSGLDVEFRPWNAESELRDLHAMDIGLYPLPEDPWTLGKCAFKAIQYMSCGIPVVASPVGVLKEVVQDGTTGLLPATPDAWVEGLVTLLRTPELRHRMGGAGRTRAEDSYSVAYLLPRLESLLREVGSR